ncbi:hypothetical protein CAEBREN_22044 [Caenorhabditis brenneri]|uniref:F-box domain-containing protein n=1 Tax=Caenorhabditis brenneri TaxID=135651 RepID=G0NXJ0_CAEBE|nr:hypothetical protein CAEBREN_22044 [Caenorhabditis brenneri]
MSFPLRRLPFLAINEVIQSMDTRAIFFLSVLSKKSANFVMLSIPRNSLSANFTFRKNGFLFELMPKGFQKQTADIIPEVPYISERASEIKEFSDCGLYVKCGWTYFSEVEKYTRKLFYRFSKTFKNSKFHIKLEYDTREELAMEIMRFAWGNDFLLNRIYFYLHNSSSESIQELLNRCNDPHTSLFIRTKLPKGFRCTPPPGGFKFETLSVNYAHWVNPDDFLQCRVVSLWGRVPRLTVKYVNELLKKIVNSECRLENFALPLWKMPRDFAQIVRGLSVKEGKHFWDSVFGTFAFKYLLFCK